jgi:hypothetical protein
VFSDIRWWQTDDLWLWALDAVVIFVRVAAERIGQPVRVVCVRIDDRHDISLTATG